MKDRKLATRYARALLAALSDAPSQNLAGDFLDALAGSFETNASLRAALLDPAVPSLAKSKILEALAISKGAPPRIVNFLGTVVAHRRMAQLPSIAEVYREERERAQGTVSATLTTATAIPPEVEARAAAALTKLAGRTVKLRVKIDPLLLGGAVAQVGSMMYDGSIRTQLDQLRRTIGED